MHAFMRSLAKTLAILGGTVLFFLILLTCASVVGREINALLSGDALQSTMPGVANALLATGIGPINGDFEIVEAGVAFAIFAFMPLCQITAGHASVDIFTNGLSKKTNRFLRMVAEIAFAAVFVLIAVQLTSGLMSKFKNGETSFLLQFPIWWAYALSLSAAIAGAVIAVYMAIVRIAEFIHDRTIVFVGEEAQQ